VDFRGAEFLGWALFRSARFVDIADFEDATSRRLAVFSNAKFGDCAKFAKQCFLRATRLQER
jgi:hypothetical protein